MSLISDLKEILKGKKLIGLSQGEKQFLIKGGDRRLKHRVKEKLINNIILYQSDILKEFYVFTILRLKNKKSKIEYGKQLLKKTLSSERFKLSLDIVEILLLYSSETEHKKEFKALALELLEKIKIEHLIISNYCEVLEGAKPIDLEPVSLRSTFYFYFSRMCYFENNYPKLKLYGEQALKKLSEYPNSTEHKKHILLKGFIPTIINKGDNSTIIHYLSIEEKGTINYFTAYCYHAIFWSYKADYNQSIQICQSALKSCKTPSIIELLRIIEAWENVMIDSNFRFSKFLNDITIFARQKSEDNAGLILLKFLYWFKKGNTDKVIDNEISLKRYAKRYVTGRMLVMYQFIFLFIKYSFNPAMGELERLKSELNAFPRLDINIEIVPFEVVVERFFNPK